MCAFDASTAVTSDKSSMDVPEVQCAGSVLLPPQPPTFTSRYGLRSRSRSPNPLPQPAVDPLLEGDGDDEHSVRLNNWDAELESSVKKLDRDAAQMRLRLDETKKNTDLKKIEESRRKAKEQQERERIQSLTDREVARARLEEVRQQVKTARNGRTSALIRQQEQRGMHTRAHYSGTHYPGTETRRNSFTVFTMTTVTTTDTTSITRFCLHRSPMSRGLLFTEG